jgi:hypothetical protein
MLETLARMVEVSPHLRRFLAHTETLLWLEQAQGQLKAAAAGKNTVAAQLAGALQLRVQRRQQHLLTVYPGVRVFAETLEVFGAVQVVFERAVVGRQQLQVYFALPAHPACQCLHAPWWYRPEKKCLGAA